MKELKADLWSFLGKVDVICITTNNTLKSDGTAVMGAGCALEAAKRWPTLPRVLGFHIKSASEAINDSPMAVLRVEEGTAIVCFPTKDDWRNKADLSLIEDSCFWLVQLCDIKDFNSIVIPRPGCGLGGLNWEEEVKPICEKYFDDRFTIVDFP